MMAHIVIGSGPSGISVAKALLDRGRDVVMIDGGNILEAENTRNRNALAATPPDEWSVDQRDAYQSPQFSTPVGQARRHGSDFAMEPAASTFSGTYDGFGLRSSRAAGGLSNLWGGAVLPYRQQDIENWPITIDDLKPHYKAVAEFMPVSGRKDDLSDLLSGFDMTDTRAIPPGPQAGSLLTRLTKNSAQNRRQGVHIGTARQAVDVTCIGCGMCLHGCPWGYIYSSQRTLKELIANPRFTYLPGKIAIAFAETADGVELTIATGDKLRGERAFIAAGVLETPRMVLASHPSSDQSLTLLDSQHAFVPMLHRWRSPASPDTMPFNTLPQIFMEIDDPNVSPHLVHAQLYTWNEYFARDLIENYGFGLKITHPILRAIAARLIVAQVFLHSDHSAKINLRLAADGKLTVAPHANPETHKVLNAAKKKLSRTMGRAGLSTLGFATRFGPTGSSFHTGGTVPMSNNPNSGQSDPLGRPHGLSRIHLVDASIFPSIPATTITFSAMANAHRIGSLCP